jgi:hypothetical protein
MGNSTGDGGSAVREYFATRGRGHGKKGPRIQAPVRVALGSWCPSILPGGPGEGGRWQDPPARDGRTGGEDG